MEPTTLHTAPQPRRPMYCTVLYVQMYCSVHGYVHSFSYGMHVTFVSWATAKPSLSNPKSWYSVTVVSPVILEPL
jgi:hypothetical protein